MKPFITVIFIFLIIPFFLFGDTEPSTGFVATKGENDPAVPPSSEMNGDISVLQIRTHQISEAIALKTLKIKSKVGAVRFGNGIKSATLYLDENGDGSNEGDQIIDSVTFSEESVYQSFADLNISYAAGETKYILVNLHLDLKDGQKSQIEIPIGGIGLSDNNTEVIGTPVTSKEFTYICDEDPNCVDNEPTDDSDSSSINCGNSQIDQGEVCDSNSKACVELNSGLYKSGNATCNPDCLSWNTSGCEINENYNPGNVDVEGCNITVL